MDEFLGILFRWLHIIPACLAIGGVFFMWFILPAGLSLLDAEQQKLVFLRCRRVFKMVVHSSILLLLISGTYNAIMNWSKYKLVTPMSHAYFGLHVLLALAVFAISLTLLAGKEPPQSHKKWMVVNFVLLLLVVAAGSTLKWVRDHAPVTASAQTR
jgi:uncharacterized membrane protein